MSLVGEAVCTLRYGQFEGVYTAALLIGQWSEPGASGEPLVVLAVPAPFIGLGILSTPSYTSASGSDPGKRVSSRFVLLPKQKLQGWKRQAPSGIVYRNWETLTPDAGAPAALSPCPEEIQVLLTDKRYSPAAALPTPYVSVSTGPIALPASQGPPSRPFAPAVQPPPQASVEPTQAAPAAPDGGGSSPAPGGGGGATVNIAEVSGLLRQLVGQVGKLQSETDELRAEVRHARTAPPAPSSGGVGAFAGVQEAPATSAEVREALSQLGSPPAAVPAVQAAPRPQEQPAQPPAAGPPEPTQDPAITALTALVGQLATLTAQNATGSRQREQHDPVTRMLLGGSGAINGFKLDTAQGRAAQMALQTELDQQPERTVTIFRELAKQATGPKLSLLDWWRSNVPLRDDPKFIHFSEFLIMLWELHEEGNTVRAQAEIALFLGAIEQAALDGNWRKAREQRGTKNDPPIQAYLRAKDQKDRQGDAMGGEARESARLMDPRRDTAASRVLYENATDRSRKTR